MRTARRFLLIAGLALCGCQQPAVEKPASTVTPVTAEVHAEPLPEARNGFIATANRYCPVMLKNKLGATTPVERTVVFEGKSIGFCCDDCREAWDTMTDEDRRGLVAKALSKK